MTFNKIVVKTCFLIIPVILAGFMSFILRVKGKEVIQLGQHGYPIERDFSGKLVKGNNTDTGDSILNEAVFRNPPAQYRGHAMWGFVLSDTSVTEARIISDIKKLKADNFGGFFIWAAGGGTKNLDETYIRRASAWSELSKDGIEYLSEEHFKLYKLAVEEAKKNELDIIVYDDYYFPTGTVAGQFYMKHPEKMAKRLDMAEKDVVGPVKVTISIPDSMYIGAVLMNMDTFERIDISDKRSAVKTVECDVPKGELESHGLLPEYRCCLEDFKPGNSGLSRRDCYGHVSLHELREVLCSTKRVLWEHY